MNKINIEKELAKLNLNLIVIFHALYREKNVTKVAKSLGVSQSAVSHALNRMRLVFEDELYVKVPGGMVATPKAERMAVPIAQILKSLGDVLLSKEKFVVKDLTRTFRIQTTDFIEQLLLSKLLNIFSKEAPLAQVAFQDVGFSLPKEALIGGEVDLAIAGFFGALPDGFYRKPLFSDSFSCCIRKNHPQKIRRMTLQTYCSLPHILIAPGGELSGQVDKFLKKKRLTRHILSGTSGFLAAGWSVAHSEAILTAPKRLIEGFKTYLPIDTFEVPLELPKIKIVQVWHERLHQDLGHKWLREHIANILTEG